MQRKYFQTVQRSRKKVFQCPFLEALEKNPQEKCGHCVRPQARTSLTLIILSSNSKISLQPWYLYDYCYIGALTTAHLCLFVCLPVCLLAYLSICLFIGLSFCFSSYIKQRYLIFNYPDLNIMPQDMQVIIVCLCKGNIH